MQKVGQGIFTWGGSERRSDRYGNFHLDVRDYSNTATAIAELDLAALRPLEGQRVGLVCRVRENRASGHIGDLFHGIYPTMPEVGEEIRLGPGILRIGLVKAWDRTVTTSIGLEPADGRGHLWLDPRALFRLHDQTVDLFVTDGSGEPWEPRESAPE